MKEITAIIQSYQAAKQAGVKVALATVVHVEGSSYRKPGARMLVTEKGEITGAISGGCLEGDALRRALLAIVQQKNRIVTYDTTDEDVTFGVQLGCNGIVHILFEYIDYADADNPVELLQQTLETDRKPVVLCTFFAERSSGEQPGTGLLVTGHGVSGKLKDVHLQVQEDARIALQDRASVIRQYDGYRCLLEVIQPRICLVIAGAGNDAIPVVEAARQLGWQVVVADGRATHAHAGRFPLADQVIVGSPEAVVKELRIDERTAFVLMTHNYNYDKEMLSLVVNRPTPYIGSLGPRKKLDRMLEELQLAALPKIYGPIGLDIGADTADEIAIAIIAEIKAVISGRNGASLKLKDAPIHDRFDGEHLVPVFTERAFGFTCAVAQNMVKR